MPLGVGMKAFFTEGEKPTMNVGGTISWSGALD